MALAQTDADVIDELRSGGIDALTQYFMANRATLRRMLEVRISPALTPRIDASDVVQAAFLNAQRDLPNFVSDPQTTASNWLQRICLQTLANFRRAHEATQKRAVSRESHEPVSTECLMADISSPSSIVGRKEHFEKIVAIINSMPTLDREILLAIYVDDLSIEAAAQALQISYEAAKKRHQRAANRLSTMTQSLEQR